MSRGGSQKPEARASVGDSFLRRREAHDEDDVGRRGEHDSPGGLPPPAFKRPKLASDGIVVTTTKDPRGSANSDKTATTASPSFLTSHLRILQALYEKDQSNVYDEGATCLEEDVVSKDVWTMTESFLDQRMDMSHKQIHAKHTDGIYQEYVAFWEKEEDGGIIGSDAAAGTTALPIIQRHSHHQHQHHHHNGSSPGSKGGGNSGLFRKNSKDTATSAVMAPSTNLRSIHLVTRLLQRKSNLQEQQALRHATPYSPLLNEVQKRIDTLQNLMRDQERLQVEQERATALQLLTTLGSTTTTTSALHRSEESDSDDDDDGDDWGNHSRKNNSKSPSAFAPSPSKLDAMQERVSVMETKLRLWQRLATDLSALVVSA